MLVPQTDQHFCTNTWKFMLFCARATTYQTQKLRLHACATSRKPFVLRCVGTKMMVLSGHQMVTETSPGTANTAQTLQIHCVSVRAHKARGDDTRNVTLRSSPNTGNSCFFCVVGLNRGAPRSHVGAPNGPAFLYQHVGIHAVLR